MKIMTMGTMLSAVQHDLAEDLESVGMVDDVVVDAGAEDHYQFMTMMIMPMMMIMITHTMIVQGHEIRLARNGDL